MRHVLAAAERAGARTKLISGTALQLPLYQPDNPERSEAARDLVAELALADGIILGSPGYHGSISGLVKNALDYAEDLRTDARPYFSGRAVGCIATAGGWPGRSTPWAHCATSCTRCAAGRHRSVPPSTRRKRYSTRRALARCRESHRCWI